MAIHVVTWRIIKNGTFHLFNYVIFSACQFLHYFFKNYASCHVVFKISYIYIYFKLKLGTEKHIYLKWLFLSQWESAKLMYVVYFFDVNISYEWGSRLRIICIPFYTITLFQVSNSEISILDCWWILQIWLIPMPTASWKKYSEVWMSCIMKIYFCFEFLCKKIVIVQECMIFHNIKFFKALQEWHIYCSMLWYFFW